MKTLVTHLNPHLDDIAAIWLYQKFHPDFKNAEIEFISASEGNKTDEESEDQIFLGVGRGKFDEHKGDVGECATSLVWKDIKENKLAPADQIEFRAHEELVVWVRLSDLGKLPHQYGEFSVPAFIRPLDSSQEGSVRAVKLGEEILDRILLVLINKQKALIDWDKRVEFETRWGKGVGVISQYVNRSFCDLQKGVLFLMFDPKYHSVQYYTPQDKVDLEPIYARVKKLDPSASWFLHQSHKMVICGSGAAPTGVPTSLNFDSLIEVAAKL